MEVRCQPQLLTVTARGMLEESGEVIAQAYEGGEHISVVRSFRGFKPLVFAEPWMFSRAGVELTDKCEPAPQEIQPVLAWL